MEDAVEPAQMERVNGAQRTDGREPAAVASGEGQWITLGRMAARSLVMQHLFARMRYTAPHFRLAGVEGEAGTGKLLLAETLHRIGPAAGGPFAPSTAAAFLENAQTIWTQARLGLLYLSRVDELSGEKQRQLRDLLERAAHERIRTHMVTGPLQIVAGSSQPLRRLALAGGFRADLVGHLTAIRFALAPLRDRREDIPVLAEVFLRRWSRRHGKPMRGFAPGTLNRLLAYFWPGNVLELERAIAAAALESAGEWVRPIDLPPLQPPLPEPLQPGPVPPAEADPGPATALGAGQDPNLDRVIARHVALVLAQAHGNKVRAARMLGISRSTLYRLIETEQAPASDEAAEQAEQA